MQGLANSFVIGTAMKFVFDQCHIKFGRFLVVYYCTQISRLNLACAGPLEPHIILIVFLRPARKQLISSEGLAWRSSYALLRVDIGRRSGKRFRCFAVRGLLAHRRSGERFRRCAMRCRGIVQAQAAISPVRGRNFKVNP